MKGTILNQTLDTAVNNAETVVAVVTEVGKEVAGAAGGVLMEVITATLQAGGEGNISRYSNYLNSLEEGIICLIL